MDYPHIENKLENPENEPAFFEPPDVTAGISDVERILPENIGIIHCIEDDLEKRERCSDLTSKEVLNIEILSSYDDESSSPGNEQSVTPDNASSDDVAYTSDPDLHSNDSEDQNELKILHTGNNDIRSKNALANLNDIEYEPLSNYASMETAGVENSVTVETPKTGGQPSYNAHDEFSGAPTAYHETLETVDSLNISRVSDLYGVRESNIPDVMVSNEQPADPALHVTESSKL